MKRYAFALACLTLAAGCGNDNPVSPSASPSSAPATGGTATGCTRTPIVSTRVDTSLYHLVRVPFRTNAAGRVELNVSWPHSQVAVQSFVVDAGKCTDQQFNRSNCRFLLAESSGRSAQPFAGSLPAADYELLLWNTGHGIASEPVAVQVVLAAGDACAP